MNNKKFLGLAMILVLLLSIGLSGCSSQTKRTITEDVTVNSGSQVTPPVQMLRKVYAETFRAEDGTPILKAKMIYPEFKNPSNSEAISAMNAYYEKELNNYKNMIATTRVEEARTLQASAESNQFTFRPYTFERNLEIFYNGNGLLSVLSLAYEDTGGAHPNGVRISQTFDVNTGKKLALVDILGGSKEQALEKVYHTALQTIQMTEGTDQFRWFENYPETIRTYYAADDFYLAEKSIVFYYQLYAIAPYAAGFSEFEIPYASKDMFGQNMVAMPSTEAERVLYDTAGLLIDRNLTAFSEMYVLGMLKMDIPNKADSSATIYPVMNDQFRTFADLEGFIRGTYGKAEADSLLSNGRYLNKDGQLYGDMSKATGMGYYVDWNNYSYEISDIKDSSATLKIYTVNDSPAGKEAKILTIPIVKENGAWLFEKMVY